jgi:hypothetical protein
MNNKRAPLPLDNELLPDVSYTTWEVYEEALRYLESKGDDDGA